MPLPEVVLWKCIRNKQLGVKFRRQYTIDSRILDFYSPELRLGIEADGDSHFVDKQKHTEELKSDKFLLQNKKILILRFTNIDIKESLEGVVDVIKEEIKKRL